MPEPRRPKAWPTQLDARSWWLGATLVAAAAGVSTALLPQVLGFALLTLVLVLVARSSPRGRGFGFYLVLALSIVILRLLFRLLFNGGSAPGSATLLDLPFVVLKFGIGNFQLLGPFSAATAVAALTDGLRLANIVVAFGIANLAANPRKLLQHAPALLYELASTASVALNLAPELIRSVARVRRAREIRGLSNGLGAFGQLAVPVLEQTMDRALGLAASMESRGFGRSGANSKVIVQTTRWLFLVALLAAASSTYMLLATNLSPVLAASPLAFSLVALLLVFRIGNRGTVRTRYNQSPLQVQDWILLGGTGALLLLAVTQLGQSPSAFGQV